MREFLEYRVSDFMTRRPTVVGQETSLSEAESIFESRDFNGLPVVAGKRLVGLVTKLDLLRAFVFSPESIVPDYETILEAPVEQVMTQHPITVAPDMRLTRVLQQMVDLRIKSFPVVEGEELVGMIAREDVLRALRTAAAPTGSTERTK
jgi:CBS domain-containing protein